MVRIEVSAQTFQEASNILDGVYAPLTGFLHEAELNSVLENLRLPSGIVWSMPIILDVDERIAKTAQAERSVTLTGPKGENRELHDVSVYPLNKNHLAKHLFGTTDHAHPGVAHVLTLKPFAVGGVLSTANVERPAASYRTPSELKEEFSARGWQTVVAFQTRNAPHRSHEWLQKHALQHVDGLLIQPLLGPKKEGDFHDQHILGSYDVLVREYFDPSTVVLSTLHTYMRYAGPREAVFHALVRRNFGCTHMIIGRDHAGVGDYYSPYAAQDIFDQFKPDELGIEIMKYDNAAYCRGCGDVVQIKGCDHGPDEAVFLSGSEVRQRLKSAQEIPEEFMRPEVSSYLEAHRDRLFVGETV